MSGIKDGPGYMAAGVERTGGGATAHGRVANPAAAGYASARTSQLDHDRGLSVPPAELRRSGNARDQH